MEIQQQQETSEQFIDEDPLAEGMFERLVEMRRSVRAQNPKRLAQLDVQRWGSVEKAIAILYSMRGYRNWVEGCPFGIQPAFHWADIWAGDVRHGYRRG